VNQILELQLNHRSDRSFTDEPVTDEQLDLIIEAAHRAPNFFNGQQISLVVVRDADTRARISQITGGQAAIAKAPVFVAVVIDFYKTAIAAETAGTTQVIHESVEGFAVGAVDAGITLGNILLAARSLGLGAVPIGGIRNDPQAIIDLLRLPRFTFPIAGAAFGHIATPAVQKPRLPDAAFRHDEYYHPERLPAAIAAYDETITNYWKEIGRENGQAWSASLARYGRVYYPNTRPVAAAQGFLLDK
jgi:FMN reductase [NAD(P)H]